VITDASVTAAHRRAGIGRQLFHDIEQWAHTLGADNLEVGTLALDERAVAFWRSLGFEDWRVTLARGGW
jgi:GNAT superfamily N-acetyltransferase